MIIPFLETTPCLTRRIHTRMDEGKEGPIRNPFFHAILTAHETERRVEWSRSKTREQIRHWENIILDKRWIYEFQKKQDASNGP